MARPIWKGHISFGLVNVPVGLYAAEKRSEISFRMLDGRDRSRVRYERVNETTGEPVPWDQVVKGYEYDEGKYVLVDDEEIKDALPEATQTVQIEDFVDAAEVEPVYFEKPYYLVPDRNGDKGYALLRETLRKTGKVGVARVVLRTKEYLALLMTHGDLLVLDVVRFHEELRDPADFEVPPRDLEKVKITKKEVDMAVRLVESMTSEWKPERYKDEFREKLLAYIEEKAEAGDDAPRPKKAAPEKKARVIQFVDLLRQSLEEREGGGDRARGASKNGAAATKRSGGARARKGA
ncbi:MAG TPA: Ku protein [Planctomycetota bacterium]|nr:Ku protein [Planctomycetota bacterium]